jgi:hypothetical protein
MFKDSWEKLSAPDHTTVGRMLDILAGGDITPGMRAHQVGPFLSLSPNMDLRVIARRDGKSFTLFYVDHHDDAYRWASSRSILATATLSHEVVNLSSIQLPLSNPDNDKQLPIPISKILEITNEDQFLTSVAEMSPEWQEWLLNAFTTKNLESPPSGSSLVHVIGDDMPLKDALTYDFPNWQIFLHPTQEKAANDTAHRSIAITGGPGTGKTVVLLNRLLRLSPKERESDCSVLLSYSEGLSDYLKNQILRSSSRHAYVLPIYYLD